MTERAAWLEQRRTGIGGSDAAALFGVSPWGNPLTLYASKVLGQDSEDEDDVTSPLYWGRLMEGPTRQAYMDRTGETVVAGSVNVRHPEHPFMLANTDGLILAANDSGRPRVFEGKCTLLYNASDWDDGGIPLYYRIQIQHYMAVLGLESAVVACLILGLADPLIYREEPRNDAFIAAMIEREREFWEDHVLAKKPPAPGSDETAAMAERSKKALSRLWPSGNGSVVLLPESAKVMAERIKSLADRAKAAELEIENLKNRIRHQIGGASFGLSLGEDGKPEFAYSYSEHERAAYSVPKATIRTLRVVGRKRLKGLLKRFEGAFDGQ